MYKAHISFLYLFMFVIMVVTVQLYCGWMHRSTTINASITTTLNKNVALTLAVNCSVSTISIQSIIVEMLFQIRAKVFKCWNNFLKKKNSVRKKRHFFLYKNQVNQFLTLYSWVQSMFSHDIDVCRPNCLFILINQLYKCALANAKDSKSDYRENKIKPVKSLE